MANVSREGVPNVDVAVGRHGFLVDKTMQ